MIGLLNEIVERAHCKHQIDKRRDQGQQNLENDDIRKSNPAQNAFAGERAAVFPDRLQNSEGPAEALTHQAIGIDRRFSVGEGQVFIFHAIAGLQQRHSQVRIFGHGVGVIAAGFAHR